jgi:hypothetical protein
MHFGIRAGWLVAVLKMVDRLAAQALDLQLARITLCQQLAAVGTADFIHFDSSAW